MRSGAVEATRRMFPALASYVVFRSRRPQVSAPGEKRLGVLAFRLFRSGRTRARPAFRGRRSR
jgi:hypothetical protein